MTTIAFVPTSTSTKVLTELSNWHYMTCTHEAPYHLWCKGKCCWEFSGLSSRFTEMHMKGIKARGVFYIPVPRDMSDFNGYHNGIMKKHPEWRARLKEMTKYGRGWQRFVKYYDECEAHANEGKYELLGEVMACFSKEQCKLYYYVFPASTPEVELKEYLVMGSMIPRKHSDEFDIAHCCVLDKLPKFCKLTNSKLSSLGSDIYDASGKWTGWARCDLYHPEKREVVESNNRVEAISKFEHNFVDSFNSLSKSYDDKMLELYKRMKLGEYIKDDELPNRADDYKTTNTSVSKKEEIYNTLLQKLADCSELLGTTEEFDCSDYDSDKCLEQYNKLSSLNSYIEYYNREAKEQTHNDIIDKIQQLNTKLGEKYLSYFTEEIKVHDEMNNWIKYNPETFQNVVYHYCPHYVLYDEKDSGYDDTFALYSVEIDDGVNDTFGILTCLISISPNHILHPDNHPDDFEVDWMDMSWSVSGQPVSKCVYYEDGLMNA